jgi:hypothetical protein
MYIENIVFNGANAFASHSSNSSINLNYVPALFCNISKSPYEKDELIEFSKIASATELGF